MAKFTFTPGRGTTVNGNSRVGWGAHGPQLRVTATDTPAVPDEGKSATYLVTSAVSWPPGLVWSTDPDGGAEPAITGTALVSLFTVAGVTRAVIGATFNGVGTTTSTTTTAATTTTTTTAATTTTTTTLGAATITDDFNRADGNAGASWAAVTGQTQISIISNRIRRSVSNSSSYHVTPLAGPNHWAEIARVYPTSGTTANNDAAVLVRVSTSARTHYMGRYYLGNWEVHKLIAGTTTLLASTAEAEPADGTVMRLVAQGSTLRLYGGGVLKVTVTDTDIVTGVNAGIRVHDATATCDNFAAGNA